jgi:hypothetical protein
MKKSTCYRFLSMLMVGILVFSTCQKDEDKPILLKVSPESGRAGDPVIISGLLLDRGTRVVFGTTVGVVNAVENKTVSTQVPAGLPAGKMSVTIETNGGISNPLEFTVIPSVPEITAIAPAKGSPGTHATLTGRYFSDTKEVMIGDQKITALESSTDTQLVITIPSSSTPGEKAVTVTTAGGTSNQTMFTVVPPPAITSFAPTAGLAGKHILISGTNLTATTAVYFQDAAAVFEVKSASLIDAVVPAGAATGKLKVVGEGGDAVSSTDFVVEGAPVISSFAPASGTIATEVIINGANFMADAKVKFGDTYAKTTFVSDKQLKATVPAGAAFGAIVVETAAGTGTSSDTFLVIGVPSVASFSPIKGVAGITRITITGTNFKDVSSVKFNGAEAGQANITVNSLTSLEVKVPTLASTGTVAITNPSGSGVSATVFTVVDPSSALAFSPASGAAGASITITGFGFDNTSVVRFNGVPISANGFSLDSETSLRASVPSGSTTGKITVTTGNVTLSSAQNFTVIQPPVVRTFSPSSGPVGTQVVITGSNFDNAKVKLNGMAIGTSLNVTANTISFNVPTGASSGPISIETVAGSVSTGTFTVIPPPVITSINPTAGAVGSMIVINGTALDQATSVQINGTEFGLSNFRYLSNSLIAKIPVGATSGTITVTTPAGSATSVDRFTVAPSISSFSPASGPVGTPVTINGNNFENATGVFFNGISATFTLKSATSIEANVPTARTGTIAVTTAAGRGTSSDPFAVTPHVSSINPTSGITGAAVTIEGSGLTDVTTVTFNGAGAAFSITNDAHIAATVPETATSGNVTVTNSAGSSSTSFSVLPKAHLKLVVPSSGRPGQTLFLNGTNLTLVTQVTLNGKSATIKNQKSTSMQVIVPVAVIAGKTQLIASFPGGDTSVAFIIDP